MDDKKKINDDRALEGDPKAGIVPLAEVAKRVDGDEEEDSVSRHTKEVKKAEAKGYRW